MQFYSHDPIQYVRVLNPKYFSFGTRLLHTCSKVLGPFFILETKQFYYQQLEIVIGKIATITVKDWFVNQGEYICSSCHLFPD